MKLYKIVVVQAKFETLISSNWCKSISNTLKTTLISSLLTQAFKSIGLIPILLGHHIWKICSSVFFVRIFWAFWSQKFNLNTMRSIWQEVKWVVNYLESPEQTDFNSHLWNFIKIDRIEPRILHCWNYWIILKCLPQQSCFRKGTYASSQVPILLPCDKKWVFETVKLIRILQYISSFQIVDQIVKTKCTELILKLLISLWA